MPKSKPPHDGDLNRKGESMHSRRHRGTLLLLCFFSCLAVWPAFGQTSGVEMTLQCRSPAKAAELRITLRNTGTTDINLVLGMTLGNGREYFADALFLEVKRRDSDTVESYQYSDPGRSATIAGRVDPWIVPLPAGSEFSITRLASQFWSRDPREMAQATGQLSLERGPLDLRLKLISRPQDRPHGDDMVGAGLVHVMPDELQSRWIHVPEECKAD